MKVPAVVSVFVLLIVGYLVLKSVMSTLRFSAKLMSWMILLILTGAAVLYFRSSRDEPSEIRVNRSEATGSSIGRLLP